MVGGEIFRTLPDRPSLEYNKYRVFCRGVGGLSGRGVALTTHTI